MMYIVLSLIIGVSAAILVWAVFLIEKDLSPSTLERLDRIKRKTNVIESREPVDVVDITASETDYKFKATEVLLENFNFSDKIREMLKLADSNLQVDTFIILVLASGLPFLLFLLTPFPLISLLAFLGFYAPVFYLKFKKEKRFQEFSKQFPDALNLMASSLRAGHPLYAAMEIVTDEMPKPLCDVFLTARKDLSLGVDAKDAFLSMTRMMPDSLDLRFFITAVLIQKEVGGNLAQLLDSLSTTIRERFKLMGQLRVLTAQSRLSGVVLAIVPLAVLGIIFITNPEYIKPMMASQDGQIALAVAFVLMFAGFISMRKISDIEF